jgi:hypothetical protein
MQLRVHRSHASIRPNDISRMIERVGLTHYVAIHAWQMIALRLMFRSGELGRLARVLDAWKRVLRLSVGQPPGRQIILQPAKKN